MSDIVMNTMEQDLSVNKKESIEEGIQTDDKKLATLSEVFSNCTYADIILMLIGSCGSLVTGLSLPYMNILFGKIIDNLNSDTQTFQTKINKLCFIFTMVGIINLASGFFQVTFWSLTGERQSQQFRIKFVKAILSQEVGWFDTCGASELSTKVAELTGKIQDGTGRKIGDSIQLIAQFLGSFAVGFYLSWKLTVVLLACFPLIAYSGTILINAVGAATKESLEQYAAAGGLASETLGAIRTVTALNIQPDVVTKYRKFLFSAMHTGIIKGRNVGFGNGLLFCSCFLTYALGFWYGTKLIADAREDGCSGTAGGQNCISGGVVLATFFSVLLGSMALGQVAPPLAAFTEARVAIKTIMKIINRKPTIDGFSELGDKPDGKPAGAIELRDVTFAYPSRLNVIVCKDYHLKINSGETVALVGASGCGKSTIINLLLRFYDPLQGDIFLDGYSLKNLNIRWLRSQIGYVGQEPILFAGTIGDNIAYGLNSASSSSLEVNSNDPEIKDKIIAAAKLANAHDFITSFPLGYDTDVGNGGIAMSGGQKQRIAIARALIKKPAVLLLDEATSALDASSERIVQQSIDALQKMKTQTTIIIAHRLSTIRNADRICVIQSGKIAEMGTHDELVTRRDGLYADLIKLQMHSDESNSSDDIGGTGDFLPVVTSTKDLAIDDETKNDLDKVASSSEQIVSKLPVVSLAAMKDAEAPLSKEERKKVISEIWRRVLEHKTFLIFSMISAAIFGGVYPCWGLLLARTQNTFYLPSIHKMREQSAMLSYLYIGIAFVTLFSATGMFWGMAQVGERVSCKIRSDLFEALLHMDVAFFDEEVNNVGTLCTRLADECRSINKAFGESLAKLVQALFTLAIGFGLAFSASWQIALVVLACFPVVIFGSIIQMQKLNGDRGEDNAPSASAGENTVSARNSMKSKKSVRVPTQGGGGGKSAYDAVEGEGVVENTVGGVLTGTGHGAVIASAFTHMRTVCAFSMQHKVEEHYAGLTNEISELRCKNSYIAGFGFGFGQGTLFCIYALLFWFGAILISKGTINFEQLMTAIFTIMFGAFGLGAALGDLGDQKQGVIAARNIFETIEISKKSPIDGLSTRGSTPTVQIQGRIELLDVYFRYPTRPDVEVCKGYNFAIEPGQMVALIGPSGSGKSTIVNLLMRFYNPESGQLLLDGIDITELNVRWLRAQIGYVGQEPVLFSGTVADNVANGRKVVTFEKPLLTLEEALEEAEKEIIASKDKQGCMNALNFLFESSHKPIHPKENKNNNENNEMDLELGVGVNSNTPDDIIEACIASNAHDFITSFPKGYNTDVGESSMMVSGGQKQRIAIARALIKKPAVLLLDEATSALDASSERIVQQSIDALQKMKTQTTIIIAHRLSTIRNADKIIVVDSGNVIQIGTHDELLTTGGLYSQLWHKQNGTDGSSIKSSKSREVLA